MFCVVHIYKLLILGAINRKCLEKYKPHQNTSVDEAMIAFRGRMGFRQCLPGKPTRYGIQVWMWWDSENGNCNQFDIYTEKSGDNNNTGLGLCSRVVVNLTKAIENKNHIINIDNYFIRYDLFKVLSEKKSFARGTARSNRKHFPNDILNSKSEQREQLFGIASGLAEKNILTYYLHLLTFAKEIRTTE